MSRLRHHRDETPRSNYLGGSNQGSHLPALLGPGRVRQLRDTSVYREGADAYRICSVPGESILALVGQLIFQARCRAFHSLDSVAIDGSPRESSPDSGASHKIVAARRHRASDSFCHRALASSPQGGASTAGNRCRTGARDSSESTWGNNWRIGFDPTGR
jgi:hypothetical protein